MNSINSTNSETAAPVTSNPQPPTSDKSKPLASISLDLDNQWSYMKTHGDPGWEKFPSYLNIFIPHILDILDRLNLKITFFVVGQDAALDKNWDFLKLLIARGHEVGNHSFSHNPCLHLYEKNKLKMEILETDEQIIRITGQKPIGFRGPGFSWSTEVIDILGENGYLYDASTFPTYIGPLARLYYFWTSKLTNEEKKGRRELFGNFRNGFKPVKPYYWKLKSDEILLEIPVTTIPVIKIPFHLSYLLYLSSFSLSLMEFYLKLAIVFCRATGTGPSFILHPLDLMGGDKVPELRFFPGMNLSSAKKVEIFKYVLKEFKKYFNLVTMNSHAKHLLERNNLKVISL